MQKSCSENFRKIQVAGLEAKFLRPAFLLNNAGQLLLYIDILKNIFSFIKTRKQPEDFS